jgi:hypothetical protein
MSKYEKLIEYIINDEEDKARQLFHQIVVEKSREIYESIMDEETMGGDPVSSLVDEVTHDEHGVHEAEDDMEIDVDMTPDSGDEMDGDMEMGADMEMDTDGMGGDNDMEDRVMDLEDALDELKAEFDALMADSNGEDDMDMGDDSEEDSEEPDADEEADADEEDDEEAIQEAKKMKAKAKEKQKLMDKKHMSEAARLREYTEKLGDIYKQEPAKGEGHEVGKGGSVSVDKKSIVAGKNDMGGTTANIVKGGTEQDPDNKQIPEPKNEYAKGRGEVKHSKEWKNRVGGNSGTYKEKAPAAKSGEEGAVNDRSPLAK